MSLEKFPSFDAAAFERDQAASRRQRGTMGPFAPGGVFGDDQLELPWRFPSPYAHALPLGLDSHRVPLELDENARYAMGLPSHYSKDHDDDDDDAATTTPVTCHQKRRGLPAGHDVGPGMKLPPYHTPLTPTSDGGGRGPGQAAHHTLEVPKTRDPSPLPSAASRQSDPFVEKDPQRQRPHSPTPTTMMHWAYGLGPADARRQRLPAPLFAAGGGADSTPTRPAVASCAPASAGPFAGDGGEPGPDVGPAARRRADPPDGLHFAGFDGGGGSGSKWAEEDRRPSSAAPSSLSVSPLNLGRAGSVATVRDLRAMAPPHRQISIRSLVPAAPPDVRDRPIIVTNALNHILYDGPCRHCEVNNCVCLLPSTTPSPSGAPASANADDDNSAAPSFGNTALGQPPDNDIMTEGFCRHCVVNHCACVGDAKWGLHHAANALRNARLDEEHHRDTATRRLVSDSGTVRRYESTSTEAEDGDGGSSSSALRAGRSSPLFAAPLPAYLPLGRERVSSVDRGGFYDLETQPRRDGSGSSGRDMVSVFHFRRSFRAGGAGQGSSLRGRRTRGSRLVGFVAGHLCRFFVVVILILLIAVMAWVVWFYTNRDGVHIT